LVNGRTSQNDASDVRNHGVGSAKTWTCSGVQFRRKPPSIEAHLSVQSGAARTPLHVSSAKSSGADMRVPMEPVPVVHHHPACQRGAVCVRSGVGEWHHGLPPSTSGRNAHVLAGRVKRVPGRYMKCSANESGQDRTTRASIVLGGFSTAVLGRVVEDPRHCGAAIHAVSARSGHFHYHAMHSGTRTHIEKPPQCKIPAM
jgi:hypothetical protein